MRVAVSTGEVAVLLVVIFFLSFDFIHVKK